MTISRGGRSAALWPASGAPPPLRAGVGAGQRVVRLPSAGAGRPTVERARRGGVPRPVPPRRAPSPLPAGRLVHQRGLGVRGRRGLLPFGGRGAVRVLGWGPRVALSARPARGRRPMPLPTADPGSRRRPGGGRTSCPGPARVGRLVLARRPRGGGHRVLRCLLLVSRDRLRTVSAPIVAVGRTAVNAPGAGWSRAAGRVPPASGSAPGFGWSGLGGLVSGGERTAQPAPPPVAVPGWGTPSAVGGAAPAGPCQG